MSRSRRHLPIATIYNPRISEKRCKHMANKTLRAKVRVEIKTEPEPEVLSLLREVSNVWFMAKDGRAWHGYNRPEMMRK